MMQYICDRCGKKIHVTQYANDRFNFYYGFNNTTGDSPIGDINVDLCGHCTQDLKNFFKPQEGST